MRYTVIVATRYNNGNWGVALHDDKDMPPGLVENRLYNYLNRLSAEGWAVVSSAATEHSLTVILGKAQ